LGTFSKLFNRVPLIQHLLTVGQNGYALLLSSPTFTDKVRVLSFPSRAPAPSVMGFSRVLVACHDPATAAFFDHQLRSWGYMPLLACDGPAATRILRERNPPRIAILDVELSTSCSEELTAGRSSNDRTKPLWTIVLCEPSQAPAIAATIATGADGSDDLLVTPVNPTDLRSRMAVAIKVQAFLAQMDSLDDAARFHASHDKLTGLLNRDALLRQLFIETDRALRMNTALTLVVVDLDYFSRINLDYGYEAGDRILRELAKRFRRFMRSYDLIGRCGEDEFLIGLPGCVSEEAFALAQRVKRMILHRPFSVGGNMLTLTASAGISHSRGRSPLVVLREAEQALASAKLSGRNCERQFAQLTVQQSQRTQCHALPVDSTRH
jgi:two-component system, cell cycle response regulator